MEEINKSEIYLAFFGFIINKPLPNIDDLFEHKNLVNILFNLNSNLKYKLDFNDNESLLQFINDKVIKHYNINYYKEFIARSEIRMYCIDEYIYMILLFLLIKDSSDVAIINFKSFCKEYNTHTNYLNLFISKFIIFYNTIDKSAKNQKNLQKIIENNDSLNNIKTELLSEINILKQNNSKIQSENTKLINIISEKELKIDDLLHKLNTESSTLEVSLKA